MDVTIFIAVDPERNPVGVILDSTGITNYYVMDEEEEITASPWPEGAREFNPATDSVGFRGFDH